MAKADNFLFRNWVLVYGVVSNCYWFNSPLATSSAAQYLLLLITLNQKTLLGALAEEEKNRKVLEFFPIWEFLTDFPLFLPFCGSLTSLLTKFPHVPLYQLPLVLTGTICIILRCATGLRVGKLRPRWSKLAAPWCASNQSYYFMASK